MGLALGFGLIVDNSIVVLENIHRQWESGGDPFEASVKGARDVILPILASTFTTLIVFLPFLYLQGEMRIFYLPLAVVVALTLGASILVAFTFIPALTARTLRRSSGKSQAAAGERPLPIYLRFYSGILGHTLRHPWITMAVVAGCFGASWYVFDNHVSRGSVFGGGGGAQRSSVSIRMTMARGSDMDRLNDLALYFEERLANIPEISQYTAEISGSTATIRSEFPEELNFTAVPLVVQEKIGGFALGFTGVQITVSGDGPAFSAGATGSTSPNYRLVVLGYNYERLGEIAEDLGGRLARNARVQSMNTNASSSYGSARLTEVVATIDRDAVDRHGITVADAISLLTSSVRGPGRSGAVVMGGESVSFQVRLEGYEMTDVGRLLETIVTTPSGIHVPLGEIFEVTEREVVTSILRENQQYERTIAYEFRGPGLLGNVVRDSAVAATRLPPGYTLRDRTPFRLSSEDQAQIRFVLLISLGLIFMVTAALYESVRQPFCILLTVPMALIGVFLIFFYANISFTREAYLGVIMMGGIVVNNAILLVDHINRVRQETTLPLFEAIIQATLDRVRPILMTTATTIFGLLPLVLFTPTVNATIWNALTYALIGGLLSSTLFVLTTTPALYYLFERGRAGEPSPVTRPAEGGGAAGRIFSETSASPLPGSAS
jgi:HAE1 family hydrophobic/amphiphilic exporter-1